MNAEGGFGRGSGKAGEESVRVDEVEEGSGEGGGDQGHEDHHGVEGGGQELELKAGAEDDELHEASGVHEDAEGCGLASGEFGGAGGEGGAAELAGGGDAGDQGGGGPEGCGVEE